VGLLTYCLHAGLNAPGLPIAAGPLSSSRSEHAEPEARRTCGSGATDFTQVQLRSGPP